MKKSTKKTLMALAIIFIFGLSSLAFVFSGFGGSASSQNKNIKPLSSFVVDGEIDTNVENAYIQGGFTFVKFYYSNETPYEIISFIEQVPSLFPTPSGQTQVIVQKITDPVAYAKVVNINGEIDVFNITNDKISEALCSSLIVQSTECALNALHTLNASS